MKSHGSSYLSEFEMVVLLAVLGVLCFTQGVQAQSSFLLPCPPPFPDFESIFARTLQLNDRFRHEKLRMQTSFAKPPNCSCSPDLMSNIQGINANRCRRNSVIPKLCLTTSASPSTPSGTTWSSRQASVSIPDGPPTVSYSTDDRGSTTATVIRQSRTTTAPSPGGGGGGDGGGEWPTTGPVVPPLPGTTGGPTPDSVKSKDNGITIVVIAVGAGVLLVVFLIGSLLMCRKRLCADNGVLGARLKHGKAQRQRSDCQPISAISRNDTFEDGYAPSMISSAGSIGSVNGGFGKEYVTNGRKWRPDFDSETGSEKSAAETKYVLLREDSSASALSFSFHYNTLRTIENPHALMVGGFGESSTDMTLPRTMKKRHAEGSGPLDFIEEGMPNQSEMTRKRSKDSLNSIEIYDKVSNPRVVFFNGMANGHGPPSGGHRTNTDDSASLGTIDQADEALEDPVLIRKQSKPVSRKHGVTNPTFQGDDSKPEPDWQDLVLEELKLKSNPPEDDRYDSLVNNKNVHIFGYSNDSLDSGASGARSVLDPPAQFRDSSGTDFRDSSGTEISVAVVQPIRQNPKVADTKQNNERGVESPSESSPAKKQPPPVAKKPQNGHVKQNLEQPQQASMASGSAAAAAAAATVDEAAASEPVAKHSTIVMIHNDPPPTNGYHDGPLPNGHHDGPLPNGHHDGPLPNGHHDGPLPNGHIPNGAANGAANGTAKSFKARDAFLRNVQQIENSQKPSAHVQPRRYLDADTRL